MLKRRSIKSSAPTLRSSVPPTGATPNVNGDQQPGALRPPRIKQLQTRDYGKPQPEPEPNDFGSGGVGGFGGF